MKNRNKYIILATMLVQSVMIIVFNITIYTSPSLNIVKRNIPFFNLAVSIITIFMFISVKKLSYYEKKEAELELIKANLENTEELIKLLHSQKNDYITHMQTIGALLYLEKYEELSNFLNGISDKYKFSNKITRFGHPALTALINSKKEMAWEKGIFFYISCKEKIDSVEIDSWELCSVVSNLIENSIEAVSITEGKKWIKIIIDYYDENFICEIENKGYIKEDVIKKLFEPGTTSKNSTGRGYGLYICKKIVDKYKGTIEVRNTDNGTVISTIRLPGKVDSYDKKVS